MNYCGGNGLETYVWNELLTPSKTIKIGQTIHNDLISATGQKNRGLKNLLL